MTKYDNVLMGIAQEEGSIGGVLNAFFDFLHRNTDFYVVSNDPQRKMGFAPGQAEDLLHQSFNRFPLKYIDTETKEDHSIVSTVTTTSPVLKSHLKSVPVYTKDGKQVPVGNGGITSTYTWTQSLRDVTVHIDVPQGTKSKDIQVAFTHTSVSAGLKGKTPLVQGRFPYKIKLEDTVWSLDSNQSLILSIEKTKETWWKNVVEGDPEIDTSMVNSTQHMHEYDRETQGAIRKIMYDQRHEKESHPSMSFPTSLDME